MITTHFFCFTNHLFICLLVNTSHLVGESTLFIITFEICKNVFRLENLQEKLHDFKNTFSNTIINNEESLQTAAFDFYKYGIYLPHYRQMRSQRTFACCGYILLLSRYVLTFFSNIFSLLQNQLKI